MNTYNPYQMYQPPIRPYTGTQEITRVTGENGARAYQMPPNSSALLLDETAPVVWLVSTDGAGFKTVNPFSITPYKEPEPVDVNQLEQRITALEAKIDESNFTSDGEAIATNEPVDTNKKRTKRD